MSEHEQADSELLNRFKSGDKDAANELMGRYFSRVVNSASHRLKNRRLRSTDSEDIAVSVFESLWKKADQQQFCDDDLIDGNEFWRLLCTMIRFKTESHVRRENAEKRGGGKLRGESVFEQPGRFHAGIGGVAGGEMTPEEIACFKDRHLQMMKALDDPTLQEIVTLRMENHKVSEIAERLGKSDRWVKRKLAEIRQIWQRELVLGSN